MTHVSYTGSTINNKGVKKPLEITMPVTVIECPPIKIASVRLYKKVGYGIGVEKEILLKTDKELAKKIKLPKEAKADLNSIKPDDFEDIRVNVYTQPKMTGIGKKKPEFFEVGLGGNNADKLEFIKANAEKEILFSDIFSEGEQADIVSVTKGKGYQGPVKRFGVKVRQAKSEKTKRGPGSLGGWKGHAHFMYRISHAGQMGFHNRTEYNKWIVKIGDKVEDINPKGGFVRYGLVKNNYVLVKGSVGGSLKRLIKFKKATRPPKNAPKQAPSLSYISTESKQGR